MVNLKVKEEKKNGKLTLGKLLQQNAELAEEVEQLIAREYQDRRLALIRDIREEFGDAIMGSLTRGQDPHYGLYEALQTPLHQEMDKGYLFGNNKENDEEYKRCAALRESTLGADPTNAQGGVTLKKYQTEGELRVIQLIANSRYRTDPYCRGVIDNVSRYIASGGIKFVIGNEQVEEVVDEFLRQITLGEIFVDFVKTSFKDGEVGMDIESVVVKDARGIKTPKAIEWSLSKVFTDEIRAFEVRVGKPEVKGAYQYFPNDTAGTMRPQVEGTWIPDIEYFYQFDKKNKKLVATSGAKSSRHGSYGEDRVILWFKHGDIKTLRGSVPIEPILRDLRLYEDFRISRAVLNYERSKVLYVKTVNSAVNRAASTIEVRKSPAPKGGVQLTLAPGEKMEMLTASLQAADADRDGLQFQYAMGTGVSMPVYILGVRADEQNYGAIKNTDSPFNQMILEYAELFSAKFLKKLIKFVIYRNVQEGILPETVKVKKVSKEKKQKWETAMMRAFALLESDKKGLILTEEINALKTNFDDSTVEEDVATVDVPLEAIIAESIKPNPLELAKVAFIERKLSIVSSRTLSEERGRNWQQEVLRMLEEKALGLYDPMPPKGQADSSNSGSTDMGNSVDDGSGTTNQNSK